MQPGWTRREHRVRFRHWSAVRDVSYVKGNVAPDEIYSPWTEGMMYVLTSKHGYLFGNCYLSVMKLHANIKKQSLRVRLPLLPPSLCLWRSHLDPISHASRDRFQPCFHLSARAVLEPLLPFSSHLPTDVPFLLGLPPVQVFPFPPARVPFALQHQETDWQRIEQKRVRRCACCL